MTKEEFITKAKEAYGDKYDYSKVVYKGYQTKVRIICPEHGVFEKTPSHFLRGQGCPYCSGRVHYTTESFIKKAKSIHPEYDYGKSVFKTTKDKVIVTCKEHGDFQITPNHLFNGQGCPKCRYIKSANSNRRSLDDVIKLAREVHGDKYDYSKIMEYKNDRTKYPIVCPEHGVFYMTMNNHIQAKQGCPICGKIKYHNSRVMPFEKYVKIANEIHNNKYQYVEGTYHGTNGNVTIICPKHGAFIQDASNHIHLVHECPKCAVLESKGEDEIYAFLVGLLGEDNVIQHDRIILGPKEIDIYIPSLKIGIEYDGLYWHSEIVKDTNYHLQKTEDCENKGIRLIHIFEDEWHNKQVIVKSMLKNLLGKTDRRIYARKCEIRQVSAPVATSFLDSNHLQGRCPSMLKLGLFYNDELVSLMAFGKSRHFIGNGKTEWELLRFCNKINTNVIGAASKLLKHFIQEYNPNEIVSYADRRISVGNLYEKLGFELYNKSKPNYFYIIDNERKYRFNFRKNILMKKYGCPSDMSEHEFCLSQKWYRIYDCGCLCYRWRKNYEESNNR